MSRLPCAQLKITWQQPLGLWPGRVVAAHALEFDRHGMALQVDRPIIPGTHLLLRIEDEQLAVDALDAVVHNCREWPPGFRCGVQFRHALDVGDDAPLHVALRAIERRLQDILRLRQHFK